MKITQNAFDPAAVLDADGFGRILWDQAWNPETLLSNSRIS